MIIRTLYAGNYRPRSSDRWRYQMAKPELSTIQRICICKRIEGFTETLLYSSRSKTWHWCIRDAEILIWRCLSSLNLPMDVLSRLPIIAAMTGRLTRRVAQGVVIKVCTSFLDQFQIGTWWMALGSDLKWRIRPIVAGLENLAHWYTNRFGIWNIMQYWTEADHTAVLGIAQCWTIANSYNPPMECWYIDSLKGTLNPFKPSLFFLWWIPRWRVWFGSPLLTYLFIPFMHIWRKP